MPDGWLHPVPERIPGWAGRVAILRGSSAHLAKQPCAGGSPTTLYGGWGNAQEFRSVFNGEAGKIAQLDNLALLGIEFGKPVQSFVESQQIHIALRRGNTLIQGQPRDAGSALSGAPVAFIIHQNPSHELCSNAKKVIEILNLESCFPGKP